MSPAPRPQVGRSLGLAKAGLEQLRAALILVAERHERQHDVAAGATVCAIWAADDIVALEPLAERYGLIPSEHPERLRAALLGGTRVGGLGLLLDLQDLAVLAEHVLTSWTVLFQGGKELHDPELLDIAGDAREHARRTLAWAQTQIEHAAPETLAVALDPGRELATSLPKRPTSLANVPDSVWGPVAAGVGLLVVGLLALLAGGRPWLLPSLGPSAVLFAEQPAHPSARAWNTVMGHVGGLLAGFAGVLIAGATSAPPVLVAKELVPARVVAAVVAIALTLLLGALLRASHPPAAATTLLVALGSIATLEDVLSFLAGLAILTAVGELLRRVRLGRVTPEERDAPTDGLARRRLRAEVPHG